MAEQFGTPIFTQKGTPQPIMKDGREIGTRWVDEEGRIVYFEMDADESMMRISPETQQRLKEIDRAVIVGPSPLRRRFARW